MKNTSSKKGVITIAILMIVAALYRLLPHPSNFTPILSIALLGGAVISRKHLAFLLPILAFFVSDFILNNTIYAEYNEGLVFFQSYQLFTYLPMLLITLLGIGVFKKLNWLNVIGGSLASALIFFILSNFGTWLTGMMYPKTIAGLIACYTAAIPFFHNSLISTVLFSGILFIIYSLYTKANQSLLLSKKENKLLFWQ